MRILANEIAKNAPYANRRLAELIDTYTYGNVSEFAKLVCMSQQRIQNLLKNKGSEEYPKYSKVTEEVKEAIIQTFDLPQNAFFHITTSDEEVDPMKDLLSEEEYKLYKEGKLEFPESKKPIFADKEGCDDENFIPLIPVNAIGGYLSGVSDPIKENDCEMYRMPLFRGADFLIKVEGDSMMPKYMPGDIVACAKVEGRLWFQWGKVYVIDTKQGALIKRIEPTEEDGCICLCSENEKYKPFKLYADDINGVALVKGVIRVE